MGVIENEFWRRCSAFSPHPCPLPWEREKLCRAFGNLLVFRIHPVRSIKRADDALAVAEIAMEATKGKDAQNQFGYLINNLKNIRAQQPAKQPGN